MAKIASSHGATSPYDLLQGVVAGTSPIVCADLNVRKKEPKERSVIKVTGIAREWQNQKIKLGRLPSSSHVQKSNLKSQAS